MSLKENVIHIPLKSNEVICLDSDDDEDGGEADSEFLDVITCDDDVRLDIENLLDREIEGALNLDNISRNSVFSPSDDSNDVIVLSDESFDDESEDEMKDEELFLGRIMNIFNSARHKNYNESSGSGNINHVSDGEEDENSNEDNISDKDDNSDNEDNNSDNDDSGKEQYSDGNVVLLVDVEQIISEHNDKNGIVNEDEIVDVENVDENEDLVSILRGEIRGKQCQKNTAPRHRKRKRPLQRKNYRMGGKVSKKDLGLHIIRERERRFYIRQMIAYLQGFVPSIKESKCVPLKCVLDEAYVYIKNLEFEERSLLKEKNNLKKRKVELEYYVKLNDLRIR